MTLYNMENDPGDQAWLAELAADVAYKKAKGHYAAVYAAKAAARERESQRELAARRNGTHVETATTRMTSPSRSRRAATDLRQVVSVLVANGVSDAKCSPIIDKLEASTGWVSIGGNREAFLNADGTIAVRRAGANLDKVLTRIGLSAENRKKAAAMLARDDMDGLRLADGTVIRKLDDGGLEVHRGKSAYSRVQTANVQDANWQLRK